MTTARASLPRLLFEDHMLMLRGIVVLAWVCLLMAAIVQFSLVSHLELAWPATDFPMVYGAVLLEFGLNTIALTALLFYPNWYERVPRESAQRVRLLLMLVIFWMGLHLFAAFQITGGVQGPLMLAVPTLLVAALVAFPGPRGWLLAAYLLAGHVAVLVMQALNLVSSPGLLAEYFVIDQSRGSTWIAAIAPALLLAVLLRQRMYPNGTELNSVQRIDPDSGLFRRAFLEQRLSKEVGRIERQGDTAVFLMIDLGSLPNASLHQAAQALIHQVRLGSDTPAIYDNGVFAVLLAGAQADSAAAVCARIVQAVGEAAGKQGEVKSAAAVLQSGSSHLQSKVQAITTALSAAQAGATTTLVD